MQCGKAFAKRGNYYSYETEFIKYKPYFIGSLVAHSRLHSGETPFACSQCDEKFNSSGKLKTHVKYHTTVEESTKNETK